MAYLKDKTLKQIGTNIVDQSNVPNVPLHLQTGTHYPPGGITPPMGNAFVSGPQGPQIYNNQMGTYPTQQSGGSKDKTLLTTPMTDEQKKKYDAAVNAYKDSTELWIQGKGPEPTPPDYTSFKNIPTKQTADPERSHHTLIKGAPGIVPGSKKIVVGYGYEGIEDGGYFMSKSKTPKINPKKGYREPKTTIKPISEKRYKRVSKRIDKQNKKDN